MKGRFVGCGVQLGTGGPEAVIVLGWKCLATGILGDQPNEVWCLVQRSQCPRMLAWKSANLQLRLAISNRRRFVVTRQAQLIRASGT